MIDPAVLLQAEAVLALARARGSVIATAESCTGGLIAAVLTAIAGSSDVVDRGFVTYSNAAKTELLGVPAELIAAVGAVSEPVARAMAQGAARSATSRSATSGSSAALAIAVTGVAGPGGGTAAKPVGLVWFGLAAGDQVRSWSRVFPGDRQAVREATVVEALTALAAALA